MGEEGCADGQDYGHHSYHKCGVRDGGESEAFELVDELQGDAEKGGEEEQSPLGCVEAWAVRDEQREKADGGEDEAVEDHCAYVHLVEGDLAEVEAATPEAAGEECGEKAESAMFSWCLRHRSPYTLPSHTFWAKVLNSVSLGLDLWKYDLALTCERPAGAGRSLILSSVYKVGEETVASD